MNRNIDLNNILYYSQLDKGVVLFKGNYTTTEKINYLKTGIKLHESIKNFNYLYVECTSTTNTNIHITMSRTVKTDVLLSNLGAVCFEMSEYASSSTYQRVNIGMVDEFTMGIGAIYYSSWNCPALTRVIGLY